MRTRSSARRLFSVLVIAAAMLATFGPHASGQGAAKPALPAITAFFVPPDETQPFDSQCGKAADRQGTFNRCSTYYRVNIPEAVASDGGKDLKVRWELIGTPCGAFTHEGRVFKIGKQVVAEAYWTHSHLHQGGDCADEFPHKGRKIVVTVTSPTWTCKARYGKAANGTQWPDLKGLEGTEPSKCKKNPDEKK